MTDSVAGIIKKDNKYLLGKRKPGGAIGGKWEFPGGKVESGENHTAALKREFLEELNIEIEVHALITQKFFTSEDHSFNLYAYTIEPLSRDYKLNEHVEFKWFSLEAIRELKNNFAPSDQLLLDSL